MQKLLPDYTVLIGSPRQLEGTRCYGVIQDEKAGYDACKVGPVPAAEIDALVVGHIRKFIESPEVITQTHVKLQSSDECPHDFGLRELREHIGDFDGFWKSLKPRERNRIAEILVKNVTITNDEVAIDMRLDGFTTITNTFTKGDFL